MDTYQEIAEVWQRLREGVLFTSRDIRRYVSKCEGLQKKEEKIKYLQEWVDTLSEEIKNIYQGYERMSKRDVNILTKRVFVYMTDLKKREKLLKGLAMNLRLMKFSGAIKKGEITPEQITQARDFPLTELIETKRNFALCPFHNEKTPSLWVKNNRYYCFGCLAGGDSISLVMKRDGLPFIQAVKKLTEGGNYEK